MAAVLDELIRFLLQGKIKNGATLSEAVGPGHFYCVVSNLALSSKVHIFG